MQVGIGMFIPFITLGILQFYKPKESIRRTLYFVTGILVLIGIFFMRWNVVIGGQLFSKSFLGFTSFKLSLIGSEGFLVASIWLVVPFFILAFLLWLFPPWKKTPVEH
jgi:predicted membrane protein